MKRLLTLLACLAFFVSWGFASEEEPYSYSYARLSYVKGDVFIQRTGDLGYEEGVVNLPLVEGDKLGTREGRAEIHFGKKNYLRLDSHTQLDFVNLPVRGYDRIKLNLLSGSIYFMISFLDEEKSFEVHTPDASFYLLEEGLYRLDVRENRETELFVYEGAMEAAGEEGSLMVETEEKLVASNGYFTSDPTIFYPRFDDSFSSWNKERDALHSRPVTGTHLPEELNEYETELAENGRWVYERPYGYVWVPYVVHVNWQPYYYGRWIWYPIIGWTWVSYDPWGWCVYHYGRWHWRLGLGWYWIPTRFWGPAWVHWYSGWDYLGWCPLSYWGYPVVIVNNYFNGRYRGSYYPAHSRALVVIRKDQLRNPHLSRVALSHTKVTSLGKISLSAKQPVQKVSISRLGAKEIVAAKVLSRSNLRGIRRSYISDKTLSQSRLKASPSRVSSKALQKIDSGQERSIVSRRLSQYSPAKNTKRSSISLDSKTSLKRSQVSQQISSRLLEGKNSVAKIKSYPSRTIRPLSSSKALPVSRSGKSYSKKDERPASERADSSRLSSKSGVKTYSPSRRLSQAINSTSPRLKESNRSFSRSLKSSWQSNAKSSISRNFRQALSSPRSSLSSRSISTPRSTVSAPKISSSRSVSRLISSAVRRSSSSSSPSRSSPSRSSPSHSSSSGKVRKK